MTRFIFALFFVVTASSLAVAQAVAAAGDRRSPELALEYNFVRSNAPPRRV